MAEVKAGALLSLTIETGRVKGGDDTRLSVGACVSACEYAFVNVQVFM